MTDLAKRNTLKALAATTGAIATTSVTSAAGLIAPENIPEHSLQPQLSVSCRKNSVSRDLEVVITNTGNYPTQISKVSPARLYVSKGEFDLELLTLHGSSSIDVGKSITISLTRHTGKRHTALDHSVQSFNDVLKNNVVLSTDVGNNKETLILA